MKSIIVFTGPPRAAKVSLPTEVIILDARSPCLAIKRLRNELQKGPCSFFWPYLKTLHGLEIAVPAVWSLEDLALLDGLPTPKGGRLVGHGIITKAQPPYYGRSC